MSDYIKQHAVKIDYKLGESWIILNEIEQSIKEKIEAVGTPLKDWNIKINRGILTGLNEAFIISKEKRDKLIKADPKSAKIIRPILRGRDIKRNEIDFQDIYIINSHNGYISEDGTKIPPININDYPAIKNWLDNGEWNTKPKKGSNYERLEKRTDKGITPYNLRSLAYMDDLNSPKVVWNRIASKKVFGLVPPEFVVQDSVHFITGEHLKYLTAILNSKLFSWLMTIIIGDAAGGNAGNASNVKDLTIIKPTENIINKISRLLEEHDTKEIDKIIYNLYALTDEEIRLVSSFK